MGVGGSVRAAAALAFAVALRMRAAGRGGSEDEVEEVDEAEDEEEVVDAGWACCGLGGGFGRVSRPASTCVWAVGMAQTQGTVPVGGQRRWIQWVGQSMANPRW